MKLSPPRSSDGVRFRKGGDIDHSERNSLTPLTVSERIVWEQKFNPLEDGEISYVGADFLVPPLVLAKFLTTLARRRSARRFSPNLRSTLGMNLLQQALVSYLKERQTTLSPNVDRALVWPAPMGQSLNSSCGGGKNRLESDMEFTSERRGQLWRRRPSERRKLICSGS
jgi:hypothetical protein